jgi:peroxiredoxin Q/BCP
MVEEGKPAPDFELEADDGRTVRLSELRGRPVVLYFYPKDDTPGCTAQACGIRDVYGEFRERGAEVFGISADDQASHAAFREKYELPFTLLADPDREAGEAYGVIRPESPYFERSTFIVGADGNVARVMRKVDPTEHADLVLASLPG